jgi:hypothetical protein
MEEPIAGNRHDGFCEVGQSIQTWPILDEICMLCRQLWQYRKQRSDGNLKEIHEWIFEKIKTKKGSDSYF